MRTPAPASEHKPAAAAFTCIGQIACRRVAAMALCCDGQRVVGGHFMWAMRGHYYSDDDCDVAIWDVRRPGQCVLPVLTDRYGCGTERVDAIEVLAASADGSRVVVGCWDGLWLWDEALGRMEVLMQGLDEGALWDEGDDVDEEEQEDFGVACVAITPDGRYAVSGSRSGAVRVWDLQTAACISRTNLSSSVRRVAINPEGRTVTALLLDRDVFDAAAVNARLLTLRAVSGKALYRPVWLTCGGDGRDGLTPTIAMSADGRVVLALDRSGSLVQWADGEAATTFSVPAGKAYRMALSADGRRAVLGHEGGDMSVWDVLCRTCVATLPAQTPAPGCKGGWLNSVVISADGRHAASYVEGDRIYVWYLG